MLNKKQTKLSKDKKDKKLLINVSLDEINASYAMIKKRTSVDKQKVLRKWVDIHREKLKELGYSGKLPKRIKIE